MAVYNEHSHAKADFGSVRWSQRAAGGHTHQRPQVRVGEDVAVVGDGKSVAMNAELGGAETHGRRR